MHLGERLGSGIGCESIFGRFALEGMNMKRIFTRTVFALFIVMALASCKQKPVATVTGEVYEEVNVTELKTVRLALDRDITTNHTGIFVSYMQDFFGKAGLNLEFVYSDDKPVEQLLIDGDADFAVSSQDKLLSVLTDTNNKLLAIAAINQHSSMGFISAEDKNIASLKDLEGKRVVDPGLFQRKIIEAMFKEDGADFSKVKFVKDEFEEEYTNLYSDKADAIFDYVTWVQPKCELNGLDTRGVYLKDVFAEFDYYTPLLISSETYINANPELTRAFLTAVARGYKYSNENPAISTLSMDGKIENFSREIITESQVATSPYYLDEEFKFGHIDQERWDAFNAWLFEKGVIDKKLKIGEGFTNDYLPE